MAQEAQLTKDLNLAKGSIVQEWLWDDDVDDTIRAQIQEMTGEDLVDEDYDGEADNAIMWWRDGDVSLEWSPLSG